MSSGVPRTPSTAYKVIPVAGGVPARTASLVLEHDPNSKGPTASWETFAYGRSHWHSQALATDRAALAEAVLFPGTSSAALSALLDGLLPVSEGQVNLNCLDISCL